MISLFIFLIDHKYILWKKIQSNTIPKIHGTTYRMEKMHHKLLMPLSKFQQTVKSNMNLIKIVDYSNLIEFFSVQYIILITMASFLKPSVMIMIRLTSSLSVLLQFTLCASCRPSLSVSCV